MTIRRQPADFIVEERVSEAFIASLRERGEPRFPHAVYTLAKTSLTTPDAVQHLARALRTRPNATSYAGLKDKHAQTTQLVSVHASGALPASVDGPGWTASLRGWCERAIDSEAIEGNRFTIVVRDLSRDACTEMDRRAAALLDRAPASNAGAAKALLVVNYFGDQRFGSARHGGGFVARRLIEGDFEGALRLAIGTPARKDSGAKRQFTRLCATMWGRWPELLAQLPRSPDRAAVECLAAGGSFRDAFAALPAFFQLMCVEAFQSHLWNATARALATRIAAEAGGTLLKTPDDFGELVFPAAGAVGAEWRDLVVPLLAPKSQLVEPWAGAAGAALASEGIDLPQLRIPGLRRPFFGETPRPLLVRAERFDLTGATTDELTPSGKRLKRVASFELPRGAYATVVLRALGQ